MGQIWPIAYLSKTIFVGMQPCPLAMAIFVTMADVSNCDKRLYGLQSLMYLLSGILPKKWVFYSRLYFGIVIWGSDNF